MKSVKQSIRRVMFFASLSFLVLPAAVQGVQVRGAEVVVETPQGTLVGEAAGPNSQIGAFLGVPYAKPPVGELRWRAPGHVAAWTGRRDARRFAPYCTQRSIDVVDRMGGWIDTPTYLSHAPYPGSEDCLYLNVWAPSATADAAGAPVTAKRPVMVWVHGGGNVRGSSYIDGSRLAAVGDVVIVSVGFRLGYFGFLAHPALQTSPGKSANYGLLDQIAALEWVRSNIEAFGGDPDNVTIFGISGGGRDILALLSSPAAEGLFHRAIAMGGLIPSQSVAEVSNYIDDEQLPGTARSTGEILLQLIVNDGLADDRRAAKAYVAGMTSDAVAAYLRGKSYAEFEKAHFMRIDALGELIPVEAQMVRDGVIIPLDGVSGSFTSGTFNRVPVMLGNTRDEIQRHITWVSRYVDKLPGSTDKVMQNTLFRIKDLDRFRLVNEYVSGAWVSNGSYDRAAELGAHQPDQVFNYRFDWDGMAPWPGPDNEPYGAVHTLEVALMFGLSPDGLQQAMGVSLPQKSLADYETLSAAVMSYWFQFAHTGDPERGRSGDLPQWKAWGTDGNVMILDAGASGGPRITTDDHSSAALWRRLAEDDRLPTIEDKCDFIDELLAFPFQFEMITEADRIAFMNGKCVQ